MLSRKDRTNSRAPFAVPRISPDKSLVGRRDGVTEELTASEHQRHELRSSLKDPRETSSEVSWRALRAAMSAASVNIRALHRSQTRPLTTPLTSGAILRPA
jgi:hypothetical protein